MLPSQLAQLAGQGCRQHERVHRAAVAGDSGPRAVGRQLQGRDAGEALAPVRKLLLEHLALQPAALPQRIVRILNRKLVQR